MTPPRRRFAAALALFFAWAASLTTLAIVSGSKPAIKPAPSPRP